MKLRLIPLAALTLLLAGLHSCSKSDPAQTATTSGELTADIKARINALGFDTDGAYATDGGYIVENDIFLSNNDLNKPGDWQTLIVANTEQYRTTNLVTGLPRTIKVLVQSTLPTSVRNATDAAIARYNALGLQLTFTRITSGTANITIKKAPGGAGYIASSGFPSGGNPYSQVLFNNNYSTWNSNTLASVLAHEMGHCIGFRHTDYADRSFSCGGGYYNEGSGGVGAIYIPGTATGPYDDATSWMLSCIGNGVNRPFNSNDQVALNYLY